MEARPPEKAVMLERLMKGGFDVIGLHHLQQRYGRQRLHRNLCRRRDQPGLRVITDVNDAAAIDADVNDALTEDFPPSTYAKPSP